MAGTIIKERLDAFEPVPPPTGLPRLPDSLVDGEKKCQNCNKPGATLSCAGCLVSDIGSITTRYCSKECQKEHWARHKAACCDLRRLAHAVRMFSQLWDHYSRLTFTASAWDLVARDGNKVRVAETHSRLPQLMGYSDFCAVSERNQPTEIEVTQTILHRHACSDLMLTGLRLVKAILEPLCCEIEEAGNEPKDPAMRMSLEGAMFQVNCHLFYRVKVASGGVFAVDLSGMEYGWQEKLYTWDTYITHRSDKVECCPLGLSKSADVTQWTFGGLTVTFHYFRFVYRDSLAAKMAEKMHELLREKGKTVRQFMSQKTAGVAAEVDSLTSAINNGLTSLLRDHAQKGIGKLFYAIHPKGGDLDLRLTETKEMADKLRAVWFTAEEFLSKANDPEALTPEALTRQWKERFNMAFTTEEQQQFRWTPTAEAYFGLHVSRPLFSPGSFQA